MVFFQKMFIFKKKEIFRGKMLFCSAKRSRAKYGFFSKKIRTKNVFCKNLNSRIRLFFFFYPHTPSPETRHDETTKTIR